MPLLLETLHTGNHTYSHHSADDVDGSRTNNDVGNVLLWDLGLGKDEGRVGHHLETKSNIKIKCNANTQLETNKVKKERYLINTTRQYKIHISDKIIFFEYRTRQIKARETNNLKMIIL